MRRRTDGDSRGTGATLLVVLALITVVSILLVAYMEVVRFERTTTQNYSGEITANQIAMGGLDRLTTDLNQEIKAGSTSTAGPTATSPTYYKPVSALTMVPARYNDSGYAYTNVIRASSSNSANYGAAYPTAAYTGQVPVNQAVASSTATASPDGRFLSAVRWQFPQLLLPSETNAGVMPVPDWILVTRSGPTNATGITFGSTGNTLNNRNPLNPNYVVGRYAYIIYNEGGLLDATVAGAPTSGVGALTADDIANRGSLAMATLTNSVLTPAQMATLAAWRNITTDASENSYTNWVYGIGAANGLLQVQPGDNTFLSRQDLIGYANYAGLTSALPYLGTFNRSVNAPAYTPTTATALNPDLLTIRYANGGTINPAGTLLKSHTIQAGDFLISRRFSLSRLSWVGYSGPANGASAYDVWRAFGLVYDTTNKAWAYVSGSGTTIPSASSVKTSIETLAQVSQETTVRDPDFFELLQAGILNGSLGQTAGPQYTYTGSIIYLYGGSGDTSGYDSVQAYQIMQIGVNIIDQARADSFPTAIRFGPDSQDQYIAPKTGAANGAFAGARTFYGVKNLPYISRIVDTVARWVTPPSPLKNTDILTNGPTPVQPATTATNYFAGHVYRQPYVGCWQQIELWSPHQSTATTPSQAASLYPTALRIAASGTIHGEIYSRKTTSDPTYIANTYKPATGPPSSAPAEAVWSYTTTYIQLTSGAVQGYSEPKMVGAADVASAAANCTVTATSTTGGGVNGAGGKDFVGLYVGSSYAPDWEYSATNSAARYPTNSANPASPTYDPACVSYNTARINPFDSGTSHGTTYEMQYQDPSGVWRPYGVVKNQTLTDDNTIPISSSTVSTWSLTNSTTHARFDQGIDPRTDRFSMSKGREIDANVNAIDLPPLIDETIRPDVPTPGIGHSSDGCIPYGTAWLGNSAASTPALPPTIPQALYYLGGLMENTTNSAIYYKDPDGILRRGDSAYNNATTLDGHPGVGNSFFTPNANLARPVFLNRPFRSVGELGYVGRDMPWKTLDFFTKDSADAGLLELFSVSDSDVVAGTIDLNTRNAAALAEVLGAGAINPNHAGDSLASPITTSQANILANALITATGTHPLQSRSEMVTAAVDPATGETALTTDGFIAQSAKNQREAAIRALSEVGNARTWNLLIDIIAQSGRYPQTLGGSSSFDNFLPDGEKRYWLHIAIDRYTGKIIDRFLEPVQE